MNDTHTETPDTYIPPTPMEILQSWKDNLHTIQSMPGYILALLAFLAIVLPFTLTWMAWRGLVRAGIVTGFVVLVCAAKFAICVVFAFFATNLIYARATDSMENFRNLNPADMFVFAPAYVLLFTIPLLVGMCAERFLADSNAFHEWATGERLFLKNYK